MSYEVIMKTKRKIFQVDMFIAAKRTVTINNQPQLRQVCHIKKFRSTLKNKGLFTHRVP